MKPIGSLLQTPAAKQSSGGAAETISAKHVARLWERMRKIYGSTWDRQFGSKDDGTWLRALQGLTGEQLGLGIARCASSGKEFPPTLPLFRSLCTINPGDLGLPSVEAAYREACANSHRHRDDHAWSHAAVWHAARAVGFDALFASIDAREKFAAEYHSIAAAVAAGATLAPAPTPRGRTSTPSHRSPDVAAAALGQALALLRGTRS